MTAPLVHTIILAEGWMGGEPCWFVCAVCGRWWDTLPDYADPERFTCPGLAVVNPEATTSLP